MDINNPQLKDPKYVKIGFVVIAAIACLQCYQRADYNLALFAFAFILWELKENDDTQKIRLIYMFIFSWIMDLVWVIYWGVFWGRDFFDKKWSKGVQNYVITLASINLILKLLAIIFIALTNNNVKNALTVDGFINNVKGLISTGQSQQQQQQGSNQQANQGGNYYQSQQNYYYQQKQY